MNKSKDKAAYEQLGRDNGLLLIGDSPRSVHEPAQWLCTICQRQLQLSYHNLKYKHVRCTCKHQRTIKINHYHTLAEKLGIQWIGEVLPKSTATQTEWQSAAGDTFFAPYASLARPSIPHRLRDYLSSEPA